jgi:hypothetical protein
VDKVAAFSGLTGRCILAVANLVPGVESLGKVAVRGIAKAALIAGLKEAAEGGAEKEIEQAMENAAEQEAKAALEEREEKSAAQAALDDGSINATTKQRAGVVRPPQHHVFPGNPADRQWFAERGINVDDFAATLEQATHEAIHYGGGPGKGGGWWNKKIMGRLKDAEAKLGRKLTPDEIIAIGKEVMNEAKLGHLPIEKYERKRRK